MRSQSSFGVFVSLITFIFIFSCAESPKSSSKKKRNPITPTTDNIEAKIEKVAIKFQGQDTLSRKCDLYVTVIEEKNSVTDDHEHLMLVKLDYATLDGHKPHDSEANFFRFDSTSGKYYDADSGQGNTILTLMGFSMKDKKQSGDKNNIRGYMKSNQLDQSIRVHFDNSLNEKDFESALESIVDDEGKLEDHATILDSIDSVNLILAHGDHYHTPSCDSFEPVSVKKTTFMVSGHENHDHTDDHTDEEKKEGDIIINSPRAEKAESKINAETEARLAVLMGSQSDNKDFADNNEEEITAMALEYVGTARQENDCKVYIALHEHDHDHVADEETDEEVEALIQVDFKTRDGHKPHDGEAKFYLFNGRGGKYFDPKSDQEKTQLVLLNFSLKNKKLKADKNQINTYIEKKQLEQLVRVQFNKDVKFENYENALHQVLEKKKSVKQNFNQLNVVQNLPMALAHGDHYHMSNCKELKPTKVLKRTFDLDADHDDHEHHGHNHH